MKQTSIIRDNLIIKYEFRQNCVLIIFSNFNDIRINHFSDKLGTGNSEIESVERVIKYDSGQAAIIGKMNKGYNPEIAAKQIKDSFETF